MAYYYHGFSFFKCNLFNYFLFCLFYICRQINFLDILIPLGSGSLYNDIELRYCLRSIEKHLSGYDNVFFVGEKPAWIKNIIHLPCIDDPNNKRMAHNIYRKIMAGCRDERLTEDFIFFSDDHFFLQDFQAVDFPYYQRGDITPPSAEVNPGQHYQMWNTVNYLKQSAKGILDFNLHCPVVYNKEKFISVFSGIEWPPYGYGIKSMYFNLNQITGPEYSDLKFSKPMLKDDIYKELEGRLFFSTGRRCFKGEMKEVLQELYPAKSKYEL